MSVTDQAPGICGPLSGIAAGRAATDGGRTFVGCRRSDHFQSLIADGEGDVFFTCRNAGAYLWISTGGPALDIDRPVEGNFFDVRNCFCGVVPLAIFLKHAFSGVVSSSREISASLIVDDPALKRRYGFLDFRHVLTSMNQHDFATTIAFIPWNWWRTNQRTAAMFTSNPNRYSLVMHGCDHASREFRDTSVDVLDRKIKSARLRAERHQQRTGVHVSPIMVFPQGVFSPESVTC